MRGGSGEDQRRDADEVVQGDEPGVHSQRQRGDARLGDTAGGVRQQQEGPRGAGDAARRGAEHHGDDEEHSRAAEV